MRVIVDELLIEDAKITKETGNIYTQLGLKVQINSGSMKIYSTRATQIKEYNKSLSLHIKQPLYNNLLNEGHLGTSDANSFILYDSIGTKILVSKYKRENNLRIGVLTSGGDAPGMNSSLNSIIKTSLKNDITVYGIYRGYEGLIRGDIRKMGRNSMIDESAEGGTALLSVRSESFFTRNGRKDAVFNIVKRGITGLIVLGGDGSLNGALILSREFKELHRELIKENRFNKHIQEERSNSISVEKVEDIVSDFDSESSDSESVDVNIEYDLKIVGIPGTIDNDLYGTESTLGANTALHRVIEAVDRLSSTMRSHKRIFILECMGRNCGWITMMSAFAVNADYVMIPEMPKKDWKGEMIRAVKTAYYNHKSNIFIFVCEGAVDLDGNQISVEDAKREIDENGFDVRTLVVGHTQRGCPASAEDRIIGTLGGIKAVEYMISEQKQSKMVSFDSDGVKLVDLEKTIEENEKLGKFLKERNFEETFKRRDKVFQKVYELYESHRVAKTEKYFKEHLYGSEEGEARKQELFDKKRQLYLNAKKKTELDLNSLKDEGRKIDESLCSSYGKTEGDGTKDQLKRTFNEFNSEISRINLNCSTISSTSNKKPRIAIIHDGERVAGMNTCLNMLVQEGLCRGNEVVYFVEGYDGIMEYKGVSAGIFEFCKKNGDAGTCIGISGGKEVDPVLIRERLDEMEIDYLIVIGGSRNLKLASEIGKTILIPATPRNNIPGTLKSLGCDTAINTILMASEACKMGAFSLKNTIFLIEVGGGNCGYLSVMGGVASGAFDVICPETSSVEQIISMRKKLVELFENKRRSSVIILRSKSTFDEMAIDSLGKIISSKTKFKCQYSVLGHLEHGLYPSPIDRINANLMAMFTVGLINKGTESGVIGVGENVCSFTPIDKALNLYDETNDIAKNPHWADKIDVCSSLE